MSYRGLMLAGLAAFMACAGAGIALADGTAWPSSPGASGSPFSYDTLHPGADLNPQFVDPNGIAKAAGPLEAPPALTPHQDCIPYHQQMTRDSVYPYQPGPCLTGYQK